METDKAYPIGDRNWATQIMSQDIPPLAVRKVDDTPTVKFGTLEGLRFEETGISRIYVFNSEIKRFAPELSLEVVQSRCREIILLYGQEKT
jgi:hypothetical protein